jgi:hypothetical protein
VNLAFGKRWDAPETEAALFVDTPTGETCLTCGDPIDADDQGWMRSVFSGAEVVVRPVHAGCEAAGVIGHQLNICLCHGWGYDGRARGDEVWRKLGHSVPNR